MSQIVPLITNIIRTAYWGKQPGSARTGVAHLQQPCLGTGEVDSDDFLLDRQLRLYFQEEFGCVRPPANALRRLMLALSARGAACKPERRRVGLVYQVRVAYSSWSRAALQLRLNNAALLSFLLLILVFTHPGAPPQAPYSASTQLQAIHLQAIHVALRTPETTPLQPSAAAQNIPGATSRNSYSYDPINLGRRTVQPSREGDQ